MTSKGKAAEIREALGIFLGENQVTELRAFCPRGLPLSAAFYRDLDLMASRAASLDGQAAGVYFVPNPLLPSLVPEGRTHASGSANADAVLSRRWLLIDADPARVDEHGVPLTDQKLPSSNAEHDAAWDLITTAKQLTEGAGLSGAVVGDSGNGWHLCHPVDLGCDATSYALVSDFLAGLEARAGNSLAHIDQKTKDAPRVWKLYGTAARKGTATESRPFRFSRLVEGVAWDAATATRNTESLRLLVAAWRLQDAIARKPAAPTADAVSRARAYLEKEEPAVAGQKGHDRCWHVACICVQGFSLSDEDSLAALQDWNARCAPPWSERELLHKIEDARKKPGSKPKGYLLDQSRSNGAGAGGYTANPSVGAAAVEPDKLLIRASTVEPRAVEWLWPGRIPLGKMTTFAGVGGLGKTFVLCDLAARISAGLPWPDGQKAEFPGGVLFISGEDDADDTLVPRLIEMGADLERIYFPCEEMMGAFHLGKTALLEEMIKAASARLVVVDPPTSYLAGTDDHKNAELRQILTPIKTLAARHRCAVIFNTHVNKGGGMKTEAAARVMGSVAWVNAVRAAHMFAKDPEDSTGERRLFCNLKMNNARERKGLAYRILTTRGDLARVEWLGEVDTSADQAMNREKAKPRGVSASEWLIERFREKLEWASDELFATAKEHGVSRSAVFEAKERLKLPKPRKRVHSDGDVCWTWWVPDDWEKLKPDEPPQEKEF